MNSHIEGLQIYQIMSPPVPPVVLSNSVRLVDLGVSLNFHYKMGNWDSGGLNDLVNFCWRSCSGVEMAEQSVTGIAMKPRKGHRAGFWTLQVRRPGVGNTTPPPVGWHPTQAQPTDCSHSCIVKICCGPILIFLIEKWLKYFWHLTTCKCKVSNTLIGTFISFHMTAVVGVVPLPRGMIPVPQGWDMWG